MNSKRDTPQGKPQSRAPLSALRCRTPTLLNATCLDHGNTTSRPDRRRSALNATVQVPHMKPSVANASPFVDFDLECDLAYSDYLQALMRKEIVEKVAKQHEEDMMGQIILQRENLSKGKLALEKIKQEIVELERLDEISELVAVLSDNFAQFCALSDSFDLEDTVSQLLALLNAFANRISVKNVKTLEKQDDSDKLNSVVKQCIVAFEKMNLENKNMEEVNRLATLIRRYQENLEQVTQKQNFISKAQKNEVYKLFKSVSDMYVEKEKYSIGPKCDN